MNDKALTIGEAAKACGLSSKSIRYYEQIGLIPRAPRHNDAARTGGNRFYRDEDLRRLRFVRNSRLLGFGLKDIAELLAVSEGKGCPGAQPKYRDRLEHHLDALNERIAQLLGLKSTLEGLLVQAKRGRLAGRCGCLDKRSSSLRIALGLDSLVLSPGRPRQTRKGKAA